LPSAGIKRRERCVAPVLRQGMRMAERL
jgi:hypothetical protein